MSAIWPTNKPLFRATTEKLRNIRSTFASARTHQRRLYTTSLVPWVPVVGLEVHAQISSRSKLFSGADSNFFAPLNTVVSYFDCALPGTLPTLNRRCVEAAVITAFVLKCNVNLVSRFDRKQYFYADMPAGYQITQHSRPIAQNGLIEFYVQNWKSKEPPYKKCTNITQIQLEQDSGKTYTDVTFNRSLIDLNRAGCGLIEIVFDHNLSSGLEAACLIREMSALLKDVEACDCKMEKGQLRVDANISIHRKGESLGVKTEVKNLNSVRFVQRAIEYEINRQIELLENGAVISNETRSFDFRTGSTVPMRDKEARQDYRYMPEPNLPPLRLYSGTGKPVPADVDKLSIIDVDLIRQAMPNTLEKRRKKWLETFKISISDMLALENFPAVAEYFEKCVDQRDCDEARYMARALINSGRKFETISKVSPEHYAGLCTLLKYNEITEFTFDQLLNSYAEKSLDLTISPLAFVETNNLRKITDEDDLAETCDEILAAETKAITDYKKGKKQTMSRFIRLANEKLNGRAPVDKLEEIFVRKLARK